jgi:hypothetical protein
MWWMCTSHITSCSRSDSFTQHGSVYGLHITIPEVLWDTSEEINKFQFSSLTKINLLARTFCMHFAKFSHTSHSRIYGNICSTVYSLHSLYTLAHTVTFAARYTLYTHCTLSHIPSHLQHPCYSNWSNWSLFPGVALSFIFMLSNPVRNFPSDPTIHHQWPAA